MDAHGGGSQPLSVLVRRSFLARHKPKVFTVAGDHDKTPRKKPPLAATVRSRGVLLRTELTLLFLAQCRVRPTAKISTPIQSQVAGEPGLIDYFSTGTNPHDDTEYRLSRPTMRTRQSRTPSTPSPAPTWQLIEVGRLESGCLDRTAPMWLSQESGPQRMGDAHRYRTPSANESVISIPIEFFTKGWIQVMTDAEIANWLYVARPGRHARRLHLDRHRPVPRRPAPARPLAISRATPRSTHAMLPRLGLMTVQVGQLDVTQMVG